MEAQNRCAEIRLRAERKLGQLLAITPRLHGRPKSVPSENTLPGLSDLGIPDRKISHRAQRIAAVSADEFEAYLLHAHGSGWEITTRHLLRIAERRQGIARNREMLVGGRVSDLIHFARAGHRMGCIVVDPPWPIAGSPIMPYQTIDLDDLRALPISDLAGDRCHLHFWTLPNYYHRLAYDIIEGWGFRPVSEFVWVKPEIGRGQYWRLSHEILITAITGAEDSFDDHGLRSWTEAPRGRHSEKPEIVRRMIEQASPPPRIEIFARTNSPGWFAWGHEIAEPLNDQVALAIG